MSNALPDMRATVRFGIFEVDLRSGELRKAGVRVPLQDQPFKILVRLLEHPGALLTRDELRHELWASDTFVGFEHGLNAAIKRLRDALNDSADTPRFVETLPRRGYRFIAPVQRQPPSEGAGGRAARGRRTRLLRLGLAVTSLIALTAVASVTLSKLHRPPAVTDRDTILVADFVNRTGEEVFDSTLRQALAVELEQSPFLSVVPADRLRLTLQEMTKPPEGRITGSDALEACRRSGATYTIEGNIARLGGHYVVGLEARQCVSGRTAAAEQVEVADREHVLEGLDEATTRLRGRIGETRVTLERFNTRLAEATTPSLEALKAFSVGEETRARRGELAAEPLYRRAIEIDPSFAMAHAVLSTICFNTRRREEGARELREAVRLRGRVTEPERLYIDGRRCLSDGDGDCYVNVYQVWTQT